MKERNEKGQFAAGNGDGKKFIGGDGGTASKAGHKGGLAWGEKRRSRKAMKEVMRMWLDMKAQDAVFRAMVKMGIEPDECTNRAAITVGLGQKAIKGDVAAYNAIRDIVGEKPVEKLAAEGVSIVVQSPTAEADAANIDRVLAQAASQKSNHTSQDNGNETD